VALVFLGITLLAGERIGYTQPRSDSDAVDAAVDAFHAALANLDIAKGARSSRFSAAWQRLLGRS
jgi:hypothetical protein